MAARRRIVIQLGALAAVMAIAFAAAGTTSAAFQGSGGSGTSVAATDSLANYFSIEPGTAVQPGTSTPIAAGSGESLAIDAGRVPDSRTIADVVRVTNVSGSTQTLDLAKLGSLTPLLGFEYTDGTTSKAIPAAATEQLRLRTSANDAGAFSGSGRFELSGDSFLRYDRPLSIAQAPHAPTGLTIAAPDGTAHAQLSWTASTSSGVAGYNVYRATAAGGPYAKINGSPVAGTSYDDTTVTLGGDYWYRVRAVASGVTPELDGLESSTANVSVLAQPTSVSIPASANNNLDWVTLATRASVTFNVAVPVGTIAGDTVRLTVTSGANSLNLTQIAAGGAQVLAFSGNNLTAWADAAITMTTRIERGSFVSPNTSGAGAKDVVVPATPTAASVPATANNPVNYVNSVTASAAGVSVTHAAAVGDTIEARLTAAAVSVSGTAPRAASPQVVAVNATSLADTAVGGLAVSARVLDAAGNPSGWRAGTAATKDTVAPNNPDVTRIVFTDRLAPLADRVYGNNGAVSNSAQVRFFDYANNTYYPAGTWVTSTATGSWVNQNIANSGRPRTIGFESRDAAWNTTARFCGRWTLSGVTGTSVVCP